MKVCKLILILTLIFLVMLTLGCKNEKPKPELIEIDFLRGDLVLCGGKSLGDLKFSISCDYAVRETFNLALTLLHSFEYQEAEKAFVKVLDADPECAMAYWGVAMSIYHAAWMPPQKKDLIKATKVLEYAKSIQKSPSEAEYLEAIGAYYNDWENVDHQKRAKNYEKKMEQMYRNNEGDTEAAIFYTLALYSTRDRKGKDYINEKKAGAILNTLYQDQPNHPGIAHYLIHNYDNPELAHLALPVAKRYADIAPGSAHAQHMPSHIFTRLGLWEESIQSNLNSMAVAQCYAEERNMDGHWDEEIHAMDYLVYAYLQIGDNAKAKELYENLLSIDKLVSQTGPYNFGAIPSRIYLENRDWENAAKLTQHNSNVDWNNYPWEIAITHFSRVLGAVHSKDISSAVKDYHILKSLYQQLLDDDKQYSANQVLVQMKASEAWINLEKGMNEKALSLMSEAANLEDDIGKHPKSPGEVLPARELLGDMLLYLNQAPKALEAYQSVLNTHPNRFNSIYGAAKAAHLAGDIITAKYYFQTLINLTEFSDSDRVEVKEAKKYLQ